MKNNRGLNHKNRSNKQQDVCIFGALRSELRYSLMKCSRGTLP